MSELPPILVSTRDPIEKAGIGEKPSNCLSCAWTPYSRGFVPDSKIENPKLALYFGFPTKDDTIYGAALSGDMGAYILRNYLNPAGFKKDEVLVSHVLRCQPPWSKRYQRPAYPTGRTKEKAELACRIYDDKLIKFDPNIFLITFSPREAIKVPAYKRQLQVDFKKVSKLVGMGYRPCVLLGNEPAELIAPWIVGRGSSKAWRGTFFEIEYPWSNLRNEGFVPA